ncbi:DoxX family protein [Hoyosella sp. G463]|uniref:DoxX family protein n=1 Tax=Lolliginicoccus lacisalsi TaxID=2742202 RepID=A0A927JBP8_9ACTN|nr:DoxX family protein [Lolliginicoccus lacisalsi]MBD8506143.1 DoxX family protein [Lolliginicoccus lacisalsi]
MDLVLWIPSAILAAAFLLSGVTKTSTPYDAYQARPRAGWAHDFSPNAVRAIGILEILGALGLVLPQATGIYPLITPLAAAGLAALLALACLVLHRRGELAPALPYVGTLLVLAIVVAIGRLVLNA